MNVKYKIVVLRLFLNNHFLMHYRQSMNENQRYLFFSFLKISMNEQRIKIDIYVPTPGINIPITYGTRIGPVFGDMILRELNNSGIDAKGNILLNCHTPYFLEPPKEGEVNNLIQSRMSEYEKLRLSPFWYFERDDRLQDSIGKQFENLSSKGVVYNKDDNLFVNLNKLKSIGKRKTSLVTFYPSYYKNEFEKYLEKEEETKPCEGNLRYGYKLDSYTGRPSFLSQIWEQVLFSTISDNSKVIISGPNVIGPYTFRAVLSNLLLNESPVHVAIHSQSKLRNQKERRNQSQLEEMVMRGFRDGLIKESDYLRFTASQMISEDKVKVLDELSTTEARKTILKYYNLSKVLPPLMTEYKHHDQSLEQSIESCYDIATHTFNGLHKISKALSDKGSAKDWPYFSYKFELITGRL